MASIAFLVDNKEGHIFPSLGLAHSLREAGHSITYINIPDNESIIREEGFNFFPILQDIYPKGSFPGRSPNDETPSRQNMSLLLRIICGELDHFFRESRPDLMVITSFLCLEALLLHYKYRIRPVILTTYLRDPAISLMEACMRSIMKMRGDEATRTIDFIRSQGITFQSLPELAKPIALFPEMILCPAELEKEPLQTNAKTFYVQPSIRPGEMSEEPSIPSYIQPGRVMIYASLGSNASAYGGTAVLFYRKLVNAMRSADMNHLQLVLSTGNEFDQAALGEVPGNVTVCKWVSQIDLLRTARLMITHGGLGTVKECIYHGVPMIVVPITHDQPRNGELVQYHRLGIAMQMEGISEQMLISGIRSVLHDETIRLNIRKMQVIFREKEKERPGTIIIESLLGMSK